ncbi:MAG: hypothetical protein H0V14_09745 [Chitinophagaceae bacterium]|nr:hypothetical protein [Chitinophagaceae bacterium]
MRKFLYWLVGIIVIFLTIYILINVTYTYSEGNRAGRLIKFSNRGYIFKTYEGELNLGGINTTTGGIMVNYMWQFSVVSKSVADSISRLEGKDVTLHYKEKISTLPWRGDTKYIVDKVVEVR